MALTEEQKAKLQEKMPQPDAQVTAPKKSKYILRRIGAVLLVIILFFTVDIGLVKMTGVYNGQSLNPLIGPVIKQINDPSVGGMMGDRSVGNSYSYYITLFGYVYCIEDSYTDYHVDVDGYHAGDYVTEKELDFCTWMLIVPFSVDDNLLSREVTHHSVNR